MIVFQLLLCLVIPAVMWYFGSTFRNSRISYGKKKGVRFLSKRALLSEEAWVFANNLYFNILRMCGINLGMTAVVLYICVKVSAPSLLWVFCGILIAVQLAGGLLLPYAFTEIMLRRVFDSEGNLISDLSDEDEEGQREE